MLQSNLSWEGKPPSPPLCDYPPSNTFARNTWVMWNTHLPFFCQVALIIRKLILMLSRNFLLLMLFPMCPLTLSYPHTRLLPSTCLLHIPYKRPSEKWKLGLSTYLGFHLSLDSTFLSSPMEKIGDGEDRSMCIVEINPWWKRELTQIESLMARRMLRPVGLGSVCFNCPLQPSLVLPSLWELEVCSKFCLGVLELSSPSKLHHKVKKI